MELIKPKDEECGNCKFAISNIGSLIDRLFSNSKSENYCCRYPEYTIINPKYWCGEYKKREP